jgi:hypothetical protein
MKVFKELRIYNTNEFKKLHFRKVWFKKKAAETTTKFA